MTGIYETSVFSEYACKYMPELFLSNGGCGKMEKFSAQTAESTANLKFPFAALQTAKLTAANGQGKPLCHNTSAASLSCGQAVRFLTDNFYPIF